MWIHAVDDPRLADYRELQELGNRADPRRFIAESAFAVERLLQSEFGVYSVLGTEEHVERLRPALSRRPEVEVLVASQAIIREVVGFNFHRGVAACGARPAGLRWAEVGHEGEEAEELSVWTGVLERERSLVLVAQGLGDPANVGSLIRSARAFGVDLVVVDRSGADPLCRRAIRAAMGNVFFQPIVGVRDLARALAQLRGRGAQVLAATLGARAECLSAVRRPDHVVLMVGSEGFGLPEQLLAAADREVTIPIAPGVDSLGVAAATAVLLYGLARPVASAL